ncbi:hypothetical protein T10_7162 [Trichinella papuae]|uniref:Uncharacterized protein n=1 Tax=Trichinella papuae TaxID=268474 RepID=A0A0V1N5N8_9BILA|nr:hypothetical protein T10_7162 [Trichinella papuae]
MKIKQYFIKGNKFVPYVSKDDVKLVELMTVMPFLQKKYLVVALSQWPLARDNSNDVDKNYMKGQLSSYDQECDIEKEALLKSVYHIFLQKF